MPSAGSAAALRKKERPDQRSSVQPIIDKSLPDSDSDDDDLLGSHGDTFSAATSPPLNPTDSLPPDTDDEDIDDEGEAEHGKVFDDTLADDDWTGELASEHELAGLDTTPIDLSPLGSKKSRGQKQRTVIGGEVSSSARRHRGSKQRRGRRKNRGKR